MTDVKANRRLLVPMNIEALLVGTTPEGTGWVDLKPNLGGIASSFFLGQYLENEPFNSPNSKLHAPGIHLHWALPDGLAHGVKGNDGELHFPPVPNRWLVVRFWNQGGAAKPDFRSKAWIVESDTLSSDRAATPFPRLQSKDPGKYERVFAGKRFEIEQWAGEPAAGTDRVSITAMGYGDPAFAAYYPACKTVLGFHDRDLDALQNVNLSYLVAGWYSSSSLDPLQQVVAGAKENEVFGALSAFMGERRWTYRGFEEALQKVKDAEDLARDLKESREMAQRLNENAAEVNKTLAGANSEHPAVKQLERTQSSLAEGQTSLQQEIKKMEARQAALAQEIQALAGALPSGILCHGVITGIQWRDKNARYDRSVSGNAKVAFGNTAVEALAALFKERLNDDMVRLLEAFQFDLLSQMEEPGGHEAVDQEIHERDFRPRSRGIRWRLIEQEAARASQAANEKSPPVPGEVWMLLEKLNERQQFINHLQRDRDSAKSQLYATWYQKVLNANDSLMGLDDAALNQQIADLQKEIDRLTAEIDGLQDSEGRPKGDEWETLQSSLKKFLPGYELQALEESRFWRPNDPVVLLAGKPFQRSLRHGEDGRYRSDGNLLCRLSGQEITGIKVRVPNMIKEVEFGPADLDAWANPFAQGKSLPGEIANLVREFLFLTLDKKRADAIAYAAYEKNSQGLAASHPNEVASLSDELVQWSKRNFKDDSAPVPDFERPPSPEDDKTFAPAGDYPVIPSPVGKKQWSGNPWIPLFLQWQVTWQPSYTDISRALESWTLNANGTVFELNKAAPETPEETYNGGVLLTSSASLNFSERLRQYNLTHNGQKNQNLVLFQTAFRFMNVLCQSLAGFTENLLTRKGRTELQPLPIFDKVKDIEWLSPLNDRRFYPLRAGHLKLEKLRVVDAFGQIFDLDGDSIPAVYRPKPMSGPGVTVRLEPRLAQFARLIMEWLPADQDAAKPTDGFNPVCGWILPNFLDQSLMIYDAQGHALGALQAVKRKSWEQGVGDEHEEIEGFHWLGFPGSTGFYFGEPETRITDPLGPAANPHLRGFVNGLLSLGKLSGTAFTGLLDKMNEALSVAGGAGSAQNPNISLLIGKPLALARASIALELDGHPARSQNAADLQKSAQEQTGGIENLKFPVRLGDRRRWNGVWLGDDGLVGFFQNKNYTRFYPAYGLTGRNDDYNQYSVVPEISIATPLDLTLLIDPARGVCATTGVLPRQVFEFPYGDITETLENKHVIFYTGPVLSPRVAADKPEMRMPHPSDVYGQWSWTHHPQVQVWHEEKIADTQKDQGAFPDSPLEIAEGWLKLVTAPLSVRVLMVKGKNATRGGSKEGSPPPDEFVVSTGETIVLSWVAMGADEVELFAGQTSLFKSQRHPLPAQYAVQVQQETSFTLVATAQPDPLVNAEQTSPRQERKTIRVKVNPGSLQANQDLFGALPPLANVT